MDTTSSSPGPPPSDDPAQLPKPLGSLTAEERMFIKFNLGLSEAVHPENFGTGKLWWPNRELNSRTILRNEEITEIRAKARSAYSETTENFPWLGRVVEASQSEQIIGRPHVTHVKLNMCEFGRDGQRHEEHSDARLPPVRIRELSSIDRCLISCCVIADKAMQGEADLSGHQALRVFEAYKRNVVPGTSFSEDSSRSLHANWGTAAVCQRVYAPTMKMRSLAVDYFQLSKVERPLTAYEKYLLAVWFIEYLVEQKDVIQYSSTLGAQQLVAEIINRCIRLMSWVCEMHELVEKKGCIEDLLHKAVCSHGLPIHLCGQPSFYPASDGSGILSSDYVCFKKAIVEAPGGLNIEDDEPVSAGPLAQKLTAFNFNQEDELKAALVEYKQTEEKCYKISVLGLTRETFLSGKREDAVWDLNNNDWGYASHISGSGKMALSVPMALRTIVDGRFRFGDSAKLVNVPESAKPYLARKIRYKSQDANEILELIRLAFLDDEICADPQGIGEIISLLLHQEQSAEGILFFGSSAWVTMTDTLEYLVSELWNASDGCAFGRVVKEAYDRLRAQEANFDLNLYFKGASGHQALRTESIRVYDCSPVTKRGRQIHKVNESRIYLEREPERKFQRRENGKTISLRVNTKGNLLCGRRGMIEDKAKKVIPDQIHVKSPFLGTTHNVEMEAELNHKLFNEVLKGEYGDEAILWLLANVFCGRLKVFEGSEVRSLFPKSGLAKTGFRCYTPLKESVLGVLTYVWHEASDILYWTPFETGDVFKVENRRTRGMVHLTQQEEADVGVDELVVVGCKMTKPAG